MFGLRRAKRKRKIKKWLESIKDKNPHYYKLFKSFDFDDHQTYLDVTSTFDSLKYNGDLVFLMEKNPTQYKTFSELRIEVKSTIGGYNSILNTISYYNSDVKSNIKLRFIKNLSKEDKKRFMEVDTTDMYHFCHYSDYDDFVSFTKDYNFPWIDTRKEDINSLVSILETSNPDSVLYNKDNILIARVFDHKTMKKIGPPKWCIRKKNEWNRYSRNGKQFIVFDFNLFPGNKEHCVGYTKTKRDKLIHVFDSHNNSGVKKDIKHYLKLLKKKKQTINHINVSTPVIMGDVDNPIFNYCPHCGESLKK